MPMPLVLSTQQYSAGSRDVIRSVVAVHLTEDSASVGKVPPLT